MGLDSHALSGHITPELLAYVTNGLGPAEAYARLMGLAQMANSGAIAAGTAGYELSHAMGVSVTGQGYHPANFNISMGLDPRQNWNRNIHATAFSGGNDPTDNTNPAFLNRKLGANELGAALPGGNELKGRAIDVVYPPTGARQNAIPVVDKGPHYNDTPRY